MSAVDRYIEQVRDQVFGTRASVERLEADLRAGFEQGIAEGQSPAAVVTQLGNPEEVAAAFMADVELPYAGFFERLFAFVGDLGLCFLVATPFLALCTVAGPWLEGEDTLRLTHASVIAILVGLGLSLFGMFLLYFPLLESHFGKTLGKHLMKIQVRTEKGAKVGLGVAFLRRLSFYFEILALDALFIFFTAKKQRAFDIVAKTIVVQDLDEDRGATRYLACLGLLFLPIVVTLGIVATLPLVG